MTPRFRTCLALAALLAMAVLVAGATPAKRRAPRRAAAARVQHRTAAADTVEPSEPQIYLSWNAPYGMPGARRNIDVTCDDTLDVDTLYLSFDTGRDAPKFYGMFGRLYFHPPYGDTLATYWHWGRGWWNQGNLRVEFDPDGTFPCTQPWVRHGFGQPQFDFEPNAARLDMIYGLRPEDVSPVSARTRYCFARVLFRQRKCALPGATQPVCIEWQIAKLSFGGADVSSTHGAQRFVTVNSPDGSVAAPYLRAGPKPATWRPKDNINPNQEYMRDSTNAR